MKVVAVHPDRGIFVGTFLGLAFWTLWDTACQPCVPVFKDENVARDFFSGDHGDDDLGRLTFYGVEPSDQGDLEFAWPDDLKRAGLGHLLGDLEENAKRVIAGMETVGEA